MNCNKIFDIFDIYIGIFGIYIGIFDIYVGIFGIFDIIKSQILCRIAY